eukprot:TRINITY_DN27665_c0_g1_i1.p1 TRINITY_DN27665_c0_g1~~TRINITY_DN27665_c0_g1_i1.p1  ORF type:complete len:188 (+),score=26.17 TRINITY_DN27665_c0_g1_i1:112-675(+)
MTLTARLQLFFLLLFFATVESKKSQKLDVKIGKCNMCQSVAHLFTTQMKMLVQEVRSASNTKHTGYEVSNKLFGSAYETICHKEPLYNYHAYLDSVGKSPGLSKMVRWCKEIIPADVNYKSAKPLERLIREKQTRSEVTKHLCIDGGLCEKLWEKEEQPWRNWKAAGTFKAETRAGTTTTTTEKMDL